MNKYYHTKNISITIFILIMVYLILFNTIKKKLNKIFKKFTKDILSLLAIWKKSLLRNFYQDKKHQIPSVQYIIF